MRKFIFNGAVISAVFGLWSTIQASKAGPRDWRIVLGWVNAGIALAIAIGTVVQESKEAEINDKSR
ncbi:hypothetical protein [Leifsonia sp. NPDC058230]|uniref:hypothetical protein n=1 Tax=Leifsonia sp. NPDC058230 TaxID=3346391 RepID=UPI0036DE8913